MTFKKIIATAFTFLALLSFPFDVNPPTDSVPVDDNIIIDLPIDDTLVLFGRPPKPW